VHHSQHTVIPESLTRPGKHGVGRPLQKKNSRGVAPVTECCSEDLQNICTSPDRSVRFEPNQTAPDILLPGQVRSPVSRGRRVAPALGLRPDVRFSPSSNDSDSDSEVQAVEGQAPAPDSPVLDRRPVDIRGPVSPVRRAPLLRFREWLVVNRTSGLPLPSLNKLRLKVWPLLGPQSVPQAHQTRLPNSSLLLGGGRPKPSTQVWRSWEAWCRTKGMVPTTVCVNTLLEYLLYLATVKNFAWSTVVVHCSAVSAMLLPLAVPPLGEHPLITRFMRALFLRRPPSVRPRWTWDVSTVLTCVRDWGLAPTLDLRRLTWKFTFLLALFSARRVADLTLLRISPDFFQRTPLTAVFQPVFGAKPDRPGHQNPLIALKKYNTDLRLCPLAHLDEYLTRTASQDRPPNLLLTTVLPQRVAARNTIK
jgi:hypothetical protein